jgi:hypothetical protein
MKKMKGGIVIFIMMLSLIPMFPARAQYTYEWSWVIDRPGKDIHFNSSTYNVEPPERVEGHNTDDYASIGIGVEIRDYCEQFGRDPYNGRDGVDLKVVVTANTRKGIQYVTQYFDYLTDWYNPLGLTDTGITGDDDGAWIDMPFPVRFYGGPGAQDTSFTYSRVWVSRHGFLCFTSESDSADHKLPPNPDEPNGLIAVYWTDLDPSGGNVTYGYDEITGVFVVAWYDVYNKGNGQRETFQVVIENQRIGGYPTSYAEARGQNRIKLLYQSVSDYGAYAGLENQEGSVGTKVSGPLNGKSVWLFPTYPSPEIRELSIIASKQDSDAEIYVSTGHNILRGHNIDWLEEKDDELSLYEKAMTGGAVLLMTAAVDAIHPLCGLAFEVFLLTLELGYAAAKATWPANYLAFDDAGYGENTAYVTASAAYEPLYSGGDGHWPVDAWLATTIDWIFKDADGLSHSVDMWGRLVYYVDGLGNQTIETPSVTIQMTPDIGQTFETAKNVEPRTYYRCLDVGDRGDMYSFSVSANYVINVSMTPPGGANYDLHLYDPGGDEKANSTKSGNSTENIVFLAKTTGTWYINVTWTDWPGVTPLEGVYRLVINEPYPAPRVTVLTKTTTGKTINNVLVMIGLGCWHTSPVIDLPVIPDIYRVYVEPAFEREHYSYTFQQWNDGSTSYSRYITIDSDISLTAYYEEQFFNDPPNIPSRPSGPTSGYTDTSYTYTTSTTDPDGDDVYYQFSWGNGYTTVGPKASGDEASASHSWGSAGLYYVHSRAKDVYGAWSAWSSGLPVSISSGGGDGGCPYAYTWNGSAFVLDNNVLGMSEVSNGSDVEDFYRLEQTMSPFYTGKYFSAYSLMLGEFENEHSYIDNVRLIAVDHDPNVNVAVTPEGQILTYANPNSPVSAVDNYGCDWLPAMLEADDTYYRGFPEDYLLLDFGSLDVSQAAKLVLRANVEWKKELCIHVQVLNETGDWTDATALRTRYHWSTLIVDLDDYLPNPDGTLKIRLYFTGIHKIDYVGLDTTPQQDHTLQKAALIYAKHSENGCVTLKLLLNDQEYAELVPGEQITLKFILPNTEKTRTFIIQIEGHYHTINN